MCPKKIYTREIILKKIRDFSVQNGRPPRSNEEGLENIAYAAKAEFGSWAYALQIAGLQSYRSWHQKDTVGGKLRSLLDNKPMTFVELREEFKKISNNTETGYLMNLIHLTKGVTSIGPRRSKVYFLIGQEKIAKNHLNQPTSSDERQEIIYSALSDKVMSKIEILNIFPSGNSSTERLLKELIYAQIVGKVQFVTATHHAKYRVDELFGPLACKTYYFRFDCPEPLANFVVNNISWKEAEKTQYAVVSYLKRILPSDCYDIFERKRLKKMLDISSNPQTLERYFP